MDLVEAYVCLGMSLDYNLAIKGSILAKTKYLPLITFFIRFLLLRGDQVDLLVGAASLTSHTEPSPCYRMATSGSTLNIILYSTDQLNSCRWRVPFILVVASGVVSSRSRSPLAPLTKYKQISVIVGESVFQSNTRPVTLNVLQSFS